MRLRVYLPEGMSDWESSVALFRVGRGDSCALRFEGESAKYASWEHAEFSVDDDGVAYVTDLGSSNGTYVDGERIAAATSLRVGTTVQIGGKGPRLEVLALPPRHPPSVPQFTAHWQRPWVIVGLVAALFAAAAFIFLRSDKVPDNDSGRIQANLLPLDANNEDAQKIPKTSEPPPERHKQDAPPRAEPKATEIKPPVSLQPQIPPSLAPGLAAYRLIAVEDPETRTTWPLGGAVIVAPHALITTADVGVELARVRQRGWTVKVVRDSQDPGLPVERVRVQAPFQEAGPDEQLYFEVAILSVKERFDRAATVASDTELNAVKETTQLVCLAADHSVQPFDGFEELRPAAYEAEVLKVNSGSPEVGAPRVLSLHGQLGENVAGSPIFNDRGHLVALYCEPAALADDEPDRANHYAVVVQMGLVRLGVAQADSELWVTPVPSTEPSKKDPAK